MFASLAAGNETFCETAEVVEIDSRGRARLHLTESDQSATAQVAVPAELHPGDRVLAFGKDAESLFVIGVLDRVPARRVATSAGAYAEVSGPAATETLRVYSSRGDLLVEIDPRTDVTRVTAPSADLQLAAPQGSVSVSAGQAIRLTSQTIDLRAVATLQARVGGTQEAPTTFAMDAGAARLQSKSIAVTADQGQANVADLRLTSKTVQFTSAAVRATIQSVETIAETIVQTAKNVYATVEQLSQLRAGRIRQRAEETYHLKAGQVYLHAEQELKAQGEKIHLG